LVIISLVVSGSTSAINCLRRLVSEMTYYVLSGALNSVTHSASLCRRTVCCVTADERRDELGRIISGDFFRRRSVNSPLTVGLFTYLHSSRIVALYPQ